MARFQRFGQTELVVSNYLEFRIDRRTRSNWRPSILAPFPPSDWGTWARDSQPPGSWTTCESKNIRKVKLLRVLHRKSVGCTAQKNSFSLFQKMSIEKFHFVSSCHRAVKKNFAVCLSTIV